MVTHRRRVPLQAMADMLRVRTVVQQTLAKQDAERTNQFLHAASSGDVAKIRQASCRAQCFARVIFASLAFHSALYFQATRDAVFGTAFWCMEIRC